MFYKVGVEESISTGIVKEVFIYSCGNSSKAVSVIGDTQIVVLAVFDNMEKATAYAESLSRPKKEEEKEVEVSEKTRKFLDKYLR